jgi:hypothetical protein
LECDGGEHCSPWSFYILGAGETPAPQPEATTGNIVVQASSLPVRRTFQSGLGVTGKSPQLADNNVCPTQTARGIDGRFRNSG